MHLGGLSWVSLIEKRGSSWDRLWDTIMETTLVYILVSSLHALILVGTQCLYYLEHANTTSFTSTIYIEGIVSLPLEDTIYGACDIYRWSYQVDTSSLS